MSSKLAPERILVIKWSALGDVAIASTVMQDLRLAFPGAVIDLNTLPSAARLFAHDTRFGEVFAIDVREAGRRLHRAREWLRRVRAGRYDLIVDLQRNDRSRLLLSVLRLTTVRRLALWGNRGGFPYTQRVPPPARPQSAIEQHRALLQAAGLPTPTRTPVLHPAPQDMLDAGAALERQGLSGRRHAVLMPGSQRGGVLKRWGTSRYAEFALALLEAGAVERIAVLGGPEEVEDCRTIVHAIEARRPGSAVHLDSPPLLQVAPLCAQAACIVANDTGLAHLAAAAGRPMWVLCGPTDPGRVKPVGDAVVAIQARADCLNCYAKRCAIATEADCLARITPAALFDLVVEDKLVPQLARY
jgi:heptosyltransferase-2